ncbi:glycine betaine ABC transporter substrate-binding protein [Chromohalobacter sarecensis]|nr:glycine betaine ABC transporter substrate-binding protein [Chromohalobacter sarecensis]MCK0714454.1 hypothetical protein [Chromohalobacter sarecensis]
MFTTALAALFLAAPPLSASEAEQDASASKNGPETIANQFVFGSGEECPHEPYCLPALEEEYGLHFADFVVTDPGGPRTREALLNGDIQIGVLFTTNGYLATDRFVLLEDDLDAQPAENVIPVAHQSIGDAYPELGKVLNPLSAALTTPELTEMNRRFALDGVEAETIAREWLQEHGASAPSESAPKEGPTIVVGSGNFAESIILAEMYQQALDQAGYPTRHRQEIGNRATYLPLLESGEIDLFPEYTGSLGGWLNTLADTTGQPLSTLLPDRGLVGFEPAPAEDKNGFVVTAETAQRYNLEKISDLAKPAP